MSSIISDTQNQVFSDSSRLLAPTAVGFQVALMSVISVSSNEIVACPNSTYGFQVVTVVLFNLLRPKNKVGAFLIIRNPWSGSVGIWVGEGLRGNWHKLFPLLHLPVIDYQQTFFLTTSHRLSMSQR